MRQVEANFCLIKNRLQAHARPVCIHVEARLVQDTMEIYWADSGFFIRVTPRCWRENAAR